MGTAASPTVRVKRAHEQFLSGVLPAEGAVRTLVRESWVRSRERGVDPGATEPEPGAVSDAEFRAYRDSHRLSLTRPLIQSLLVEDLVDVDAVVAVTDAQGRLLWVDGCRSARAAASRISFVEGAVWSEKAVGTNAPGLALTVDRSVQVIGPEHFLGSVQNWNCSAAPIHDPHTGAVLGVLDITGGDAAAAPFALTAVRSVVAAVERELGATSTNLDPTDGRPFLTILDDGAPTWLAGGATKQLSPRHAEILLLLQEHPEGLSTDQLALMLTDAGLGSVTVRAEISRLRRTLGDIVESRPYRLVVDSESDVAQLRAHVATGELPAAVRMLGRGGLLADSNAPGVVELFDELLVDLRSRLVVAGDVAALESWVDSPLGRDDLTAWSQLAHSLPPGHPGRARASGRARLLDHRLGR